MNPKALAKKKTGSRILRGGLLFLSSLSLISVGFASWNIGNKETNLNFNIDADRVFDIGEIIRLDNSKGENNTGITCFDYCKDGFVNDGEVDLNNGFLYVYAKLDLDAIRKAYGPSDDINVYTSLFINVNLSFSPGDGGGFSLIDENYIYPYATSGNKICGIQASYIADGETASKYLSSSNSIDKGVLSSSFNGFLSSLFQEKNHSATITIFYDFKIDFTKLNFETDVYPHLKNGKFRVSFGMGGY